MPSADSLELLTAYRWPGNVRELRNVIERIVLMSPHTGPITGEEILQVLPRSSTPPVAGEQAQLPLDEIERQHIARVLQACGGNKTKAAQTLQIDYKTLLAKLKKYAVQG
jgi:transcriptional regulator with PAS, ATPase and Fis domain